MKKRTKEVLVVLILLVVFLIVSYHTSSDMAVSYPDYTVFSANDRGASLFYDVLKELDYPVEISTQAIVPGGDIHVIQVIICPSIRHTSYEDMDRIISWVERGGTLLVFYDSFNYLTSYLESKLSSNAYMINGNSLYAFGLGNAYFQHADEILNRALMEDFTGTGQNLLHILNGLPPYDAIYFNEYYHGYGADKTFFDALPLNIKLSVYQIVVIAAAVICYLGKRFGKPVPYYEEIEREENEYVSTLSNLYMSLGMGEVIIEMYRNRFINRASAYFRAGQEMSLEDIYKRWQSEEMPMPDRLQYILMNQGNKVNTKRPSGRREFLKTVHILKDLIEIVSRKLY